MKIKQYIVTYNNESKLNQCLASIFNADLSNVTYELYVINNHSNFKLNAGYENRVTVMNNVLRPDFSTGHLARNWNQALINGFKYLNNPDCDIVITCQDDTVFQPDFITKIIDHHETLDLLQFGHGDNCISYRPNAVKQIGLWDERFCNIGYQEADYLLRVIKFLPNHSINDHLHGRVSNPINNILVDAATGCARGEIYHMESMKYHNHSRNIFAHKWNVEPDRWNEYIKNASQQCDSYVMYPYFEKSIETLIEQRYVVAF